MALSSRVEPAAELRWQAMSEPGRLVLLRHGESEWNLANRFTGWHDADLTERGAQEGRDAGVQLAEHAVLADVVHTSLQTRAIRTAELALGAIGRAWVPVRRSWRLNERHYGDLQGRDKAETAARYGSAKVKAWRRSYDVAPPPLDPDDERSARHDPRYSDLPPELIPDTECLADVVARLLPYWYDAIVPDVRSGATVLVAAHGNSLRALVKHLSGLSDDEVVELNIPTGAPLVYELGTDLRPRDDRPVERRFLLDPDQVRARAEAVARQAG